jgi:hypothetical protein
MENDDTPRITDLSFLDAEDVKIENAKFLTDSEQEYESGAEDVEHRLRHRIWVTRNGDIRKISINFRLMNRFTINAHSGCRPW